MQTKTKFKIFSKADLLYQRRVDTGWKGLSETEMWTGVSGEMC